MGLIIATSIVAFISMFVPGVLLALALLYRKTDLHLFEIVVIGFIFGLIAPAGLTWVESFLVNYGLNMFTFSLGLFEANALALTIAGIILCIWQGVFKDMSFFKLSRKEQIKSEESRIGAMQADYSDMLDGIRSKLAQFEQARALVSKHKAEEEELKRKHAEEQKLINKLDSIDRLKLSELHTQEEKRLAEGHAKEEGILLDRLSAPMQSTTAQHKGFNLKTAWPWILLLTIMLLAFATRMFGILPSPHFFEFDPYFDMMAAQSILVYGHQFYTSYGAWPVEPAGSVMRIQPLVPYLEAYWYSLANYFGTQNTQTFNTNLMSWVSSVYPPVTAALLVFVIFMLLYHEYGKYVGLIGAAIAACMPVLFTTFVAGEQLLEPWGIFTLFFFFAMYALAIRDMKNSRLAILAGIAFASTFLGAHYYTVDAGVFAIYILLQGVISVLRGGMSRYFYKMNIIIIIVIAVFLSAYTSYNTSITSAIPKILYVPTTIAFPIIALLLVAVFDYLTIWLIKRGISFKEKMGALGLLAAIILGNILSLIYLLYTRLNKSKYDPNALTRIVVLGLLLLLVLIGVGFTPLGAPFRGYINLSTHYTTPSIPLFMTVQEYIPTGPLYNFGAAGFGIIGASIAGVPVLIWLLSSIALILIAISIICRNSKVGILYIAIAVPLMFAAFSEVKYLPHFGVAFIMLFGIIIGELLLIADSNFSIKEYGRSLSDTEPKQPAYANAFQKYPAFVYGILAIAAFFISPIISIIVLLVILIWRRPKTGTAALWALLVFFIIIEIAAVAINHQPMLGESRSIIEAFGAAYTYSINPTNACNVINAGGNGIGQDLFCNLIPSYWIQATNWMSANVGPYGARVLAWWDYGDWINWFGNSHAVLRGDNSAPLEDYASAASFVLGPKDGYGPSNLAGQMNTNQTKYVLFDQDLVAKWQALDFLACININATSKAFAIAQGQSQTPPVPYALGNSPCELQHDPQFALVPLAALVPTNQTVQSISYYCKSSNATASLISSYLVNGNGLSNQTVCVSSVPSANGVLNVFNASGGKMNAVIQSSYYEGVITVSGIPFVEYLMIYLPNGPNNTITNAPTAFYSSNYYRGFFLGDLPGFTQVYPAGGTGINFVNGTYPIRIYELNNFTGSLPPVTPKPSWVKNNFTMPA